MSHAEINPLHVELALSPVPRGLYVAELEYRRYARRINDEDTIESTGHREDAGDGITSDGFRHVKTTELLKGSVLSLNEQTLVRYETFTVPTEVTRDNVEAFMYRRPLATTAFTALHINEIGIGFMGKKRAKTEVAMHYERTEHTELHPAAEGIAKYLNGSLVGINDTTRLQAMLDDTLGYMRDIRFDENVYVNDVIDSIFPDHR